MLRPIRGTLISLFKTPKQEQNERKMNLFQLMGSEALLWNVRDGMEEHSAQIMVVQKQGLRTPG